VRADVNAFVNNRHLSEDFCDRIQIDSDKRRRTMLQAGCIFRLDIRTSERKSQKLIHLNIQRHFRHYFSIFDLTIIITLIHPNMQMSKPNANVQPTWRKWCKDWTHKDNNKDLHYITLKVIYSGLKYMTARPRLQDNLYR